MTKDQLLERARRSLRLAVLHRGLRDVSGDVKIVRESLAAAESQPAAIGVTEAELSELVRSGFLAEARIIFELAADRGSTPAERDFLFSDLVSLIVSAVTVPAPSAAGETPAPAETPPIGDDEAARVLAAHDPNKGLVPWEVARKSGEFAGVSGKDIDALNFDAIDAEPPAAEMHRLPDDDPGPFIEIDPDDEEDDYPVITVQTISIAPECLMPETAEGDAMSPEEVQMAIRFFGREVAAELGCIPTAPRPPIPLTNVVRRGTIPPPLPKRRDGQAAAEADA